MKTLIGAFVMLIVGLMILGTVAGSVWNLTAKTNHVTNESHNMASLWNNTDNSTLAAGRITLAQNGAQCDSGGKWESGSFSMVNATGATVNSGNYTIDYSAQTIRLKNTTDTDKTLGGSFAITNTSLWTYNYYPNDYMCNSFGRSMLNIVPGFIGLALLIGAIAMFYTVMKEQGLDNI